MFGAELVHAFEEVKDRFDPQHLFNPGKIVRAPKFDDRSNFRYGPDYRAEDMTTALDWSAYPGAGGGFQGAVEMCNNNGACRALAGGVMCPSYRVTRDERDVTRGRANTLRLAITGQLGPDALTSDAMAETLKLCVSCKACRRECPTGVDMARMKIEVLRARAEKFGLSLHDRLVGYLPRYAPYAARLPWLLNLRDLVPGAAKLSEAIAGFSARRSLPKWRADYFRDNGRLVTPQGARQAEAGRSKSSCSPTPSIAISSAKISTPRSRCSPPPAIGSISRRRRTADARCVAAALFSPSAKSTKRAAEAERTLGRARALVASGMPVIGLEPSCLFSFRDEIPALVKSDAARAVAGNALLFEEFLAREAQGRHARLSISRR